MEQLVRKVGSTAARGYHANFVLVPVFKDFKYSFELMFPDMDFSISSK